MLERLAYFSYWISILFIPFVFIGIPILMVNIPNSTDILFDKGMNIYKFIYLCFNLIAFFHWGYCIRFLFKYDRFSKSIFPLFFLNFIYAPIYYYRVKIKKRPLRNKINTVQKIELEDNSIDDSEFVEATRENIIGVLKLWSSKEEQLEYQENVPSISVSTELFEQWDDLYTPESEVLIEAFEPDELRLLEKFEAEIILRSDKSNTILPDIIEYIETDDWKALNSLSMGILSDWEKI